MKTTILSAPLFYFLVCHMCLDLTGQVIYVRQEATGNNNGISWEHAFTDLTTALNAAPDRAAIWISQGTYHPQTLSGFVITKELNLYGGFKGDETSVNDRDPITYQTVLSGDVNNDDVRGDFINNKSDNTRHVIYIDSILADPSGKQTSTRVRSTKKQSIH